MKPTYLLFAISLACCFTACKPDFDLNGPYKDVTIVYGVLNHQDSIHYVKIYKGFQSHETNAVFVDAKNPENINIYYYDFKNQKSLITVVLQEFDKDKMIKEIPLYVTHEFERDSGFFYYDKEKILYYTKEKLNKGRFYKIKITHNETGKITEGMTPLLGNGTGNNFEIYSPSNQTELFERTGSVSFYEAEYATDYELHVNFLYCDVNKKTKEVTNHKIVKNICPRVGEKWVLLESGYYNKKYTKTFFDDIAANVKPNPEVTRYIGFVDKDGKISNGTCIQVEGWAAGESMVKYLLSNQPTSSFTQINTIYTNLEVKGEGLAFGFFSSKAKTDIRSYSVSSRSEDSLMMNPKTSNLGFRPWSEYKKP